MKIIEMTSFKGEQNCATVTSTENTVEAISMIQALAILAVGEIATETLEIIQSHKVTISEKYARICYPNGDILEYIVEQ